MDKYRKALKYLNSLSDYETSHQPHAPVFFDLRRMQLLMERVENLHLIAPCVHIAGTKGKGSTAAMVASVLCAAGYKTGLYVSPHLIDFEERFRINGKLIPRKALVNCLNKLEPEIEYINKEATYGNLSTFEVLTAIGFVYFAQEKVDFQVVEVGLGGRLDATNVVHPKVCAITTLGMDHTDVLGDTLDMIAKEKAGIIKYGVPLVCAQQEPKAEDVIIESCRVNDAQLIRVGIDITCLGKVGQQGPQALDINGRLGSYHIELPLQGRFQRENVQVAIGALEVLAESGYHITKESIESGLNQVRWPGRFQFIRQKPLVVIDGAHNLQAAHELKTALCDLLQAGKFRKRILVIGMSSDKDHVSVAQELFGLFDIIITTKSQHPRALSAQELEQSFRGKAETVTIVSDVVNALNYAVKKADKDALICVTGSLFIVGEALKWANRLSY
ncbi:MAG: bifunctional folylpolyglutamate synthase/dihydrofolate synthase [Dehalococcoidia bacterium]|nr:bifunctional folylpolyglutamate synthase/dihydrofolate synthase [Dehalococcoidia bacterium]